MTEHTDFLTNLVEAWTLRDMRDALGTAKISELWGCSIIAAHAVIGRGRTSVDRMRVLQDEVRSNEPHYRSNLVTARIHNIRHIDA